MTSNMLAGEKRWASARRGGMTVLGKVAVPKPLNLPSQRLENHGLDPNVEIVPKGTLSWGSRSSSSASNAWGSSTLSPNADGGTSSPSHLSGRPSSGSGTRPSSSCSDRTYEPTPNAWGQNSRPSSASGALTSNQTALTSLRPRSAETRPGSSQLSRFAETSTDNSVAWGPAFSEKLGVASSKNDGFSLSSGDFPTLGSERENVGKSTDSQDHGSHSRPGSSSRAASGREKSTTSSVGDTSVNENVRSGTVDTWKKDGSQHAENGLVPPTVGKWEGDHPPPYLNANVPPQHFDAWHGPPINPPGVWYRGPPGGPPYAAPLAPGGFPIEPFPFYRPQIPPAALANSPVPPPGVGPRGHHPNNGDMYRPHIPDAYIRPGMPIRPGFYPGPVAYEGYYHPPMGYCNSSEHKFPFMGMAAGPIYNRYTGENVPDPGNNHTRAGPHGSSGKEQVQSGHHDDTRGPYKVLLKQHNEWDEKREENKREHPVPANAHAPYLGKGNRPMTLLQKNEWGMEDRNDEEIYSGRRVLGGDASSQNFDNRGRSPSESVTGKLPENRGKAKTEDNKSARKSENEAATFSQAPQVFPANPKDSTLIQKIEGLNAKARASDGWPDAASVPSRDEQKSRSQLVDTKVNCLRNDTGTGAVSFGIIHTSENITSHEVDISTADKILQPTASSVATIPRRVSHGVQGGLDHRGKRFSTHDADGWRKKPLATESTIAVSAANLEPSSNIPVEDHLPSVGAAEKHGIKLTEKDEDESLTSMFDDQAQRAKMREIAKQRALQLQKEEEERVREQKAKALAKLEELNRRTQATDDSIQKLEKAPLSGPIQQEQEECLISAEQVMVASKSETPSPALVSNPEDQIIKSNTAVGSTVMSTDTHLETSDNVQPEPIVPHARPLPLKDGQNASAVDSKAAATQVTEGSTSRHKRMGYKQKQNVSLGKNLAEMSVPVCSTEAPKNHGDAAVTGVASTEVVTSEVGPSCVSSLPMNPNIMTESAAHQRRKNNKSSKNKHKLDDVPSVIALPSAVPKEISVEKASAESGRLDDPELEVDTSSVQSRTDAKTVIQPPEQQPSLLSEEACGRVNNQWKSQHSRRIPKSQQANRMAEKDAVIWAPVRSQNKAEFMEKSSNINISDTGDAIAKSDIVMQNNLKNKRAEMERYVPKPVAKELAQQGNVQQPMLSSVNQTSLDDTVGMAEPYQNIGSSQPSSVMIGKIGCAVEPGSGNGKQNKQSKAHGSRQQRDSVESTFVQDLQDGSLSTSKPSKNIRKSIEPDQSLKPDVNSMKEQIKSSDGLNASDGWNVPENPDTVASVTSALVKDRGVTDRGKWHPFKGHRSMGNSNDHDPRNSDKSCSERPAPEISQTDKTLTSKENRGVGERTISHWQPKSRVYSVHNQRGNRPGGGGGQSVTTEVIKATKMDSPSQDTVQLPPYRNKEIEEHTVQPSIDQSMAEQKNVAQEPNVGHQEPKRERKVDAFRGRPRTPNQSSVNKVEPAPTECMDTRNEQGFAAGFRKNGNPNNRSGRGHDSGQDYRQHNTSSNRERQKHNSHYEYQPIGQYNYNKSNNFEGQTDESHNSGSRYREKSQGHSRHGGGNFYGRQSGSARVDASYD
ncbi:Protein MODIFIER OF like [Actinidia chinensis var. chinensis]|uniref:Protein MODIFIER OF like n=1 Tax=Actinidia chinensis var. chinensis TaxID=1590841 RepID=A0A2R6QGN0_ACTCC|nr:Protein MODIFIER OF like [Actinidia chinensis var. chinensis]